VQNIHLQDGFIFKAISYLLGIIGTVLFFCGGLIIYIFQSDKKQNRAEHNKLFDKSDSNEDRISRIEGRLKM
jgi:hypothetical protein